MDSATDDSLQEARDDLLRVLAIHVLSEGARAPVRRALWRLEELWADKRLRETLAKADGGR